MDVNGFIVAASEIIRLEDGDGLLFTLHNLEMQFHFTILAFVSSNDFWRKVQVNHFYRLTDLKPGTLETHYGQQIILLKTTKSSTYHEIDSQHTNKFQINDYLKSLITVSAPLILFENRPTCESKLISYQGFISQTIDSELGVYKLDNKVWLYTTFNPSCSTWNPVEDGAEVFVSNVHLIKEYKGRIILVCCGLSSVKNLDLENNQINFILPESNICLKYNLSLKDLFWSEKLSIRLQMKFFSLIPEHDVSFEKNKDLRDNVLEFFLPFKSETTIKRLSLVEEYFKNPHECYAFLEDQLPIDSDVLYLCDILNEAIENVSCIKTSKSWKISVTNIDDLVLIGIFYLSADGIFLIADKTAELPVILTQECNKCTRDQNIFHEIKHCGSAFIVAIQEYDVISENIYCEDGTWHCSEYIRTSCCRLFPLAPLSKFEKVGCSFPFQFLKEHTIAMQDIDSSKCDIENADKYTENEQLLKSLSIDLHEECQHFLVLSQIRSTKNNVTSCFRTLVLFLPEKPTSSNSVNVSHTDSFNYYETNDDLEFADLISDLNQLGIEDKPELVYLNFQTVDQWSVLFPGHIYSINLKNTSLIHETSNSSITVGSSIALCSLNVTQGLAIDHDPNCLGNHYLEEINLKKYCSIKEILLNRKIKKTVLFNIVLNSEGC